MRSHTLTTLILLISSLLCKGQDSEQIQFLKSYVSKFEKLTYVTELPKSEIEDIRKITAKDTLFPIRYKYSPFENRLILTKEDRKEINNKLDSLEMSEWYNGLHLANSQAISEDSVKAIFASDNFMGWESFHKKYGLKLYRFSKPILFRNNTLCLFYFSYSCGSLCGEGRLMIFKKEQGIWTDWLLLSMWVS